MRLSELLRPPQPRGAGRREGDSDEDTRLTRADLAKARRFVMKQTGCEQIGREFWGGGVGKICTVWLFELLAGNRDSDPWVWAVVGGLPSGIISARTNSDPVQVLQAYIEAMGRWVVAARYGQDVSGLMPVQAAPTPEMADLLDRKLGLVERE